MQKMATTTTTSSTTTATTNSAATSSSSSSSTRKWSSNSSSVLFIFMLVLAMNMARADHCQCGPRCASYKHELLCSRCCTSVMKRRSVPFMSYPAEQIVELLQQQAATHTKQFDDVELQQQLVEQLQIDGRVAQAYAVVEPQPSNNDNIENVPTKLNAQEDQAVQQPKLAQPQLLHHHRIGHLLRGKRHLHAAPTSLKAQQQQQLEQLKQLQTYYYAWLSPRRRR